MKTTRENLEIAAEKVLTSFGVRAVMRDGQSVTVSPAVDEWRLRIALPPSAVDVKFEPRSIATGAWIDYVCKQIDVGRRILFRNVIDHIAEHDHSPIDRMKQIEDAATMLLEAMDVNLEEIRMPHGASSRVMNAAYALRALLRAKPGAVSWARNGYGPDVVEDAR